jgi:hypothetical protein
MKNILNKMKISKKKLLNETLDFFNQDVLNFPYLKNITEHYRLLSYISKEYNNVVLIDAGTNFGHSCKALAQNKKNKVITYDILKKHFNFFSEYGNIEFKQMDINDENHEILKTAKLILLDIDPHDGIQEKKFIDLLININYRGYVICDDINLNENMKKWWDSIQIEKYDITEIGHLSGTGVVNFYQDGNFQINN